MNRVAVFGNPIRHSQSPCIHRIFSSQIGTPYSCTKICPSLQDFEESVLAFFASGGTGANVTLPFKRRAYKLCDRLTQRSVRSGTVNTMKRHNGSIVGDNTDGIGLVSDLNRLRVPVAAKDVLLVGAGGAAQSVADSLLQNGCRVTITNRTLSKARKIAERYASRGNLVCSSAEALEDRKFDLIVNATSSGIRGKIPNIPDSLVHANVSCYDMFYAFPRERRTPFLTWCRRLGASRGFDGLGMLVEQAAHSCLFWYGVLPTTQGIVERMQKDALFHGTGRHSNDGPCWI